MKNALTSLILAAALAAAGSASAADLRAARKDVQQLVELETGLSQQAAQIRASIERLSSEITLLKGKRRGFRDNLRLQDLLAQSRELSGRLTGLDRRIRAASQAGARSRAGLAAALDAEIRGIQHQLSEAAADRGAARKLVERLEAMRRERASLAEHQPLGPVPRAATVTADPLDGPRELRAKADFLKDSADKLHLAARELATRAAALVRDRDLVRSLREFVAEHALFDEEERSLALSRTPVADVRVGVDPPGKSNTHDEAPNAEPGEGWDYEGDGRADDLDADSALGGTSGFGSNDSLTVSDGGGPRSPISGARVDDGAGAASDLGLGLTPEAALEQIKRTREQLIRQARALEQQAREMERQAAELEQGE